MPTHIHASRKMEHQTASQLAEMGYCERKVLLSHLYGQRSNTVRSTLQLRGIAEHQRFFLQALGDERNVAFDDLSDSAGQALPASGFLGRLFVLVAALFSRSRRRG